jgi:hypothetical protein
MTKGPLKEVVDKMTEWVRVNGQLIASRVGEFLLMVINNLGTIVKWAKRIGIAIGIFLTLTTVLKTFILVMTALNLVMALNPIGLIVIAVAGLIAAFTALVVWIDEISAGFDELPFFVKAVLGPIGLLIKAIKFIKDNIGVITEAADAAGNFVGGAIDQASAVGSDVANWLGFGDNEPQAQPAPQVASPQERIARSIQERRTSAEITVRDDNNRVEVARSTMGDTLKVQRTGGL